MKKVKVKFLNIEDFIKNKDRGRKMSTRTSAQFLMRFFSIDFMNEVSNDVNGLKMPRSGIYRLFPIFVCCVFIPSGFFRNCSY